LDDFYFSHCQWAADYHERARIEEAVLIYSGLATPTVLAFGSTDRFGSLLDELIDLLPREFFCHYQKDYRNKLLSQYNEKTLGAFIKMRLKNYAKQNSISQSVSDKIKRLDNTHCELLTEFYKVSYPESYFDKRMLETGMYFGYFENNEIVTVAGIHVDSEQYSVTALGNIATNPKYRNKGLAKIVTARLLNEITSTREVITLNVKAENSAAIKCYSDLGFVKTHDYCEGFFTRK
jgi:ribosomal protein S18 acetylase RimI-like enzyme